MAEIKNDNYDLRAPKVLDKRYSKSGGVPYSDVGEAHSLITYKAVGLPFIIGDDVSSFSLFWYKGGTSEEHIVPFIGGIEDVPGLQIALDGKQLDLGFTPVPNNRQINGHPLVSNISITKADVGLGNVPNTDATDAANLSTGTIPVARYGAASIPTSAINATGGTSGDFLSKGGVWKQPDSVNLTFSNKFSNTGTTQAPVIDIFPVFGYLPSYTTTAKNALTGMTVNSVIIDVTIGAIQRWNGSAWV